MKRLVLLFTLSSFHIVFGQTWEQTNKVTPTNRYSDDYFGFRVIKKDNTIFTSAYKNGYDSNEQAYKSNSGSVYIYTFGDDQQWTLESKLVASDRESYDQFGREIELNNNTLFVSAWKREASSLYEVGAVYTFNEDVSGNWIENQIITPNNPNQYGNFGNKLASDEDVLAVASSFGNVNLFTFNVDLNEWQFQQELLLADSNTSNSDVEVLSGKVFVGKRDKPKNELSEVGQVNVFMKSSTTNEWEVIQTIDPPTIQENLEFGATIYAHNNYLFISSANMHKVFIYKYNDSSNQYEYNQEISGDTHFGADISAEDNTLVVGAYQGNGGTDFGGNAYIYKLQNDTWDYLTEIHNEDYTIYDWFGLGVCIDNDVIVAGAPYEDLDHQGNDYIAKAGAFYTFEDTSNLSNNDVAITKTATIYPNPFSRTIFIDLMDTHETIDIKLYDLTGKELFSNKYFNVKNINLDIPNLTKGSYILSIYNDKKLISNTKMIKS